MNVTFEQVNWATLIPIIAAALVLVIGALATAAVKVIQAVKDVKEATEANTKAVEAAAQKTHDAIQAKPAEQIIRAEVQLNPPGPPG